MKKIIVGLVGLVGLVGCKDSFDMGDLHEETKMVVNCFPSTEDTTWIEVTHSIPVSKGSERNQWDDFLEVKDAHVTYRVNGEQRSVGWKDRVYNKWNMPCVQARYYVTGSHQTGDRVEVEVSAPGYANVRAETVVGEAVPVVLQSIVKTKVYDPDWEESRDVYQLTATFTDPAQTQDYYAVRVRCKHYKGKAIGDLRPDYPYQDLYDNDDLRHVEWPMKNDLDYEGTCAGWGEVYNFHLQLDSLYSHPEILTMSEPLLMPLSDMDSNFGFDNGFYQHFYIFSDEKIQGLTYMLHLNLSLYHVMSPLDEFCFSPLRYQVQLYHITPEFYRYVKSINDVDNNKLAQNGFSMILPTFSNVSGGSGVVGAYSLSESEWLTLTSNKSE